MAEGSNTDLPLDPQVDDATRFDVILLEDDLSQTYGSGAEHQALSPLEEGVTLNLPRVQGDLIQIIHGTMVKDGPPATLVVFQFAFAPLGRRRIKEATITVAFSAGHVHSISPANVWITMQSMEQKATRTVGPGVKAAFGPATDSIGHSWKRKVDMGPVDRCTVAGLIKTDGQAGNSTEERNNTVEWVLHEDKQTKDGIPSFLQAAVLLQRDKTPEYPGGEEFSANIAISAELYHKSMDDTWYEIPKKISGEAGKGSAIIFDPEQKRGTVPDADNLADVRLGEYKKQVDIRPWIQGVMMTELIENMKQERALLLQILGLETDHLTSWIDRHTQRS